ncbi:hypothetical protein SKAU_G00205660 [Synaphobranchus kaupii]|uniref:Uncharacterized protein n=1 Tax=Synaphobranchus kaupii TaxID=118154 RepID=A0A9Q1IWI6_SYNKA|nr:hypothetical protein SKAU_G00205660 [Synaphobranchus kaupii]
MDDGQTSSPARLLPLRRPPQPPSPPHSPPPPPSPSQSAHRVIHLNISATGDTPSPQARREARPLRPPPTPAPQTPPQPRPTVRAEPDAVSQLSECTSHGSLEEEDVPITDIYFHPPEDRSWVYSPLHYGSESQSVWDGESET